MIEKLRESGDKAFGFKVSGKLTADELKAFEPEIERAIADRGKRTIGILADLSAAEGAEWAAQWEELRFLSRFADHIERIAVVGAHSWEDLKAEILAGTVLVRSETRYYPSAEILHAWHWVKTGDAGEAPGVRIVPKEGLMKGYVPEYDEV